MTALELADTMDGLSALLAAAGVTPNNYAYPVESVTVPCTIVGYPTAFDYDMTYGRTDRAELPVWLLVGKTGTKDARDALSAALTGAGSVKTALDGAQSFGDVRVTEADVTEVTVSGVTYIGLKFNVEVI